MKPYPTLRQNEHTPLPNKDQFTLHLYPFQILPPLHSHLHPKFAIVELGRKFINLLAGDPVAAEEAISLYPDLRRICSIYAAWRLLPKELPQIDDWMRQSGAGGDDDCQSESSSKTGYDSLRKGVKRRRTGNADQQGSLTPPRRNSDATQIASPSLETLSHETLTKHTLIYGKVGWTPESLSSWAAETSTQVTS
jgi:hypothetical protein